MRRWTRLLLTIMTVIICSHCASLGQRSVTVSSQQLQKALNQKLTQSVTVLKFFQVALSNASIRLDPDHQTLQAVMDAHIQGPLWPKGIHTRVGISGVPQYDVATQSVLLADAVLTGLAVEHASTELNAFINALAKQASKTWLQALVIHQVNPTSLTVAGTRYQPTDIKVLANGLQVTLLPAEQAHHQNTVP